MEPDRPLIRTPDQRLRVFVSSTLQEMAEERGVARQAIAKLRLTPVMFELGARPHPPRELYHAYLEQSHIFLGIYWQSYGWIAPGETISGLEDEYLLSNSKPKLIYVKSPAPARETKLEELLDRIRRDDRASYKKFTAPAELGELIENDLAVLLSERFETAEIRQEAYDEGSSKRNKLPAWPTTYVGREEEEETVRNILAQEESRLVTLTGPGGVGKSRLALHIAADLAGSFESGVFFVPLTSIRDPQLVIPAIEQALGVRESSDRTLLQCLKDFLDNKQLLLLLDNFEQVTPAAAHVADLLADCPRLKILVTSRAPLHIRGENEFPVPALRLPEQRRNLSLEEIVHSEAVHLFVQRAQQVKPDFSITDENARIVAEICQRLDGLPLAIELAAARIKLLSPLALLARLDSRLELLTGGARDLPVKQQTLRNTIDWSYDLLDEGEKVLFRRLAVFSGGCTLEGAEALCETTGKENEQIMDQMASLLDESLLRKEEGAKGEPRFWMLETIREYALERLEGSDEADGVRRSHAAFFLALAEEVGPQLRGPEREAGLQQLEAEHDNLGAALAWSQADDEKETLLRLAGALAWFWYLRGYWSEGRQWLEGALHRTDAVSSPEARAKALVGAGMLAASQSDGATARLRLEESTAKFRQLGNRLELAYSACFLGMVTTWHGDPKVARANLEESIELFREIGDKWGLAMALGFLGDTLNGLGQSKEARLISEQSVILFRELGDSWGLAVALNNLAGWALTQGDDARARPLLEESVAISRQIGDRSMLGFPLVHLADIARRERDLEHAAALSEEALALHREAGSKWGIAVSLQTLGVIASEQGDYLRSAALFKESIPLHRDSNFMPGVAGSLAGLASIAAAQGQPERAARLMGAVQTLKDNLQTPFESAERFDFGPEVSSLRGPLGQAAFEAAWNQGRAMTLEQAIDEALGVAGHSPQA